MVSEERGRVGERRKEEREREEGREGRCTHMLVCWIVICLLGVCVCVFVSGAGADVRVGGALHFILVAVQKCICECVRV